MTSRRIALLIAGATLAGIGTMLMGPVPSVPLRADVKGPLFDSDGDLLPDNLEWIVLSSPHAIDSDNDTRDDFCEAVRFEPPIWQPNGKELSGQDHSVRVIVNSVRLADGRDHVYLNLLFRVASLDPRQIRVVEPFLQTNGITFPIGDLIGTSGFEGALRTIPGGNIDAIFVSRLGLLEEVRTLLPCTVGARVVIGANEFRTGTVLDQIGDVTVAIAPVTSDKAAFQSLVPPSGMGNGLWMPNQVCLFQLVQIASGPETSLFEITGAKCQPAFVLCCDPAGCASKEGGLVRTPNGLRGLRDG